MARSSSRRPHGVQAGKPAPAPASAVTTTPAAAPAEAEARPAEAPSALGGWRIALGLWLAGLGVLAAFELVPFLVKLARMVF
jgi:hypothetical protein